jgi:glycosyltransferase involved in cell wall biosynthesis
MSNSLPDISVIIPFYNPGEAIRKCLDSVLTQTKKNLELILINDGSSDVSVAISREYQKAHSNIRLLEGVNQGVSAAYNRGLETASGEYIYFCDSDDYIDPETCEFMHSRMQHSKAQLATCALLRGANFDELLLNVPTGDNEIWDKTKILRNWYIPMQRGTSFHRVSARGYLPGCMFRRDIIEREKIRLVPGLSMNEDEIFILEYLLYVEKAILSERPLYYYCYSDNSLCANYFIHKRVSWRKQEKALLLRSEKTRRIFEKSGLTKEYPLLHAELLLAESYHRLQNTAILTDIGFRQRYRKAADIIQQMKNSPAWEVVCQNASQLPRNKKIFLLALKCGVPAVLALCAAKRI